MLTQTYLCCDGSAMLCDGECCPNGNTCYTVLPTSEDPFSGQICCAPAASSPYLQPALLMLFIRCALDLPGRPVPGAPGAPGMPASHPALLARCLVLDAESLLAMLAATGPSAASSIAIYSRAAAHAQLQLLML